RATLSTVGQKCRRVLVVVVVLHGPRDELAFRQGVAVIRRDEADLVGADYRGRAHFRLEEVRVDSVLPWKEQLALGTALTAAVEEHIAVLERAMTGDFLSQQAAGRHRTAIAGVDDTDAALRDTKRGLRAHVEEVRVDAVFPRRDEVDLRALLSAV